jgi:hypothetical protein
MSQFTESDDYCLVSIEQVDQAEPTPRANGWRYTGPDSLLYRLPVQTIFDTGYRVKLPWTSPYDTEQGTQWFNAVEPGGDPNFTQFLRWATTVNWSKCSQPPRCKLWFDW